jgi:hypothetical protein
LVGCSGASPGCADGTEVWFQRVLDVSECEGCVELRFSTPVLAQDTFWVGSDPDYVLESCGISRILVNPDAVTLVLSSDAYAPLAALRDELMAKGGRQLVVVRLAGADAPVAVLPAQGLHRVLTFFDFGSPGEIDRFVGDLRPEKDAVVRSAQRTLPDQAPQSAAQREAQQLLGELEEEFPEVERPPSMPSGK